MFVWRHQIYVAVFTLTVALFGVSSVQHALAAPAAQVSVDRAELDRALSRFEAARTRSAKLDAQIAEVSERLDTLMAAQEKAQSRLRSRVGTMYRTGETPFIAVVTSARSYEDFATGWTLLGRANKRDAETIAELKAARTKSAASARDLIALQTRAAKQVDAERREVASARRRLAASTAALAEYQQRVSAARSTRADPPSSAKPKSDATQMRAGSGAWKRAVASHYGRNFTGRGASGARIGPYSMIVAHKTLPFGTLVEIQYNGKRAVARVADRGPYTGGRAFDLGPGVIRVLGFSGVHRISYRIIGR